MIDIGILSTRERAKAAEPPSEDERVILRRLGDIDSEFNELAHFSDGVGFTSRRVGGKWGETIPVELLDGMAAKGWLSTTKNGRALDYHVTFYGRRVAAMVFYGIPYTTEGL